MWEDPIVEEIRRTREKLAAELDFDVKRIFAELRKGQLALGQRLVPQKRVASSTRTDRESHSKSSESMSSETTPAA
jgi:hypothetical protein